VQFRNFEGFEHLRSFVEKAANQTLGRFESWKNFETHIVLATVKSRTTTHAPVFECELLMKSRGLQKPIVVKKESSNFYQAVRNCVKASEKILRRESKVRVSIRRHEVPLLLKNNELAA
jgi:ribosome-associated translation inhibitor RaiA